MLGERLFEPESHGQFIDFQEAEMHHFEQLLASEKAGYDTASEQVRFELDQIEPKLGAARASLNDLQSASAAELVQRLAIYKQNRNDIREAFKVLDTIRQLNSPPLA